MFIRDRSYSWYIISFLNCDTWHKCNLTWKHLLLHIRFSSFWNVRLILVCPQSMSVFVLVTPLTICFYSLCATLILMSKTSHYFGTIYRPRCWTSHWTCNLSTCHQLFNEMPTPTAFVNIRGTILFTLDK